MGLEKVDIICVQPVEKCVDLVKNDSSVWAKLIDIVLTDLKLVLVYKPAGLQVVLQHQRSTWS